MAYNSKGKRVWPSLWRYKEMYPDDNINHHTDFRQHKRQCSWCGGDLKNNRQTSFCCKDCSKKFNNMAVWNRTTAPLPYRILHRDKFICQDCGTFIGYTNEYGMNIPIGIAAEVHHILPVSEGGSDHQSNLISLCSDCHRERHRR